MKFKIMKGTELYKELAALAKKCKECESAAHALAEKYGAEGAYSSSSGSTRAGGIAGFKFAKDRFPDKAFWMQVDRHNTPDAWYPRRGKKYSCNASIHHEIDALPQVSFDEYNKVIGFKSGFGCSSEGISHFKSYGLNVYRGYALIVVPEGAEFKPPTKELIEIVESEYIKLKKSTKEISL